MNEENAKRFQLLFFILNFSLFIIHYQSVIHSNIPHDVGATVLGRPWNFHQHQF